jgi:Reverse transcriptase (RNA-dependent DNA polymerase)/Integrase core domain
MNVLDGANTMFELGITQSQLKQFESCVCSACIKGKARRTKIGRQAKIELRAVAVLDCLHLDLVGPITVYIGRGKNRLPSMGGNIYSLTIVDEFSRAVLVETMPLKTAAIITDKIIVIIKRLQTTLGRKVKRVHTDGGGEFINDLLKEFLNSNGTRLTYTTADTPAHNGIAERMNQTQFNLVRSMLAHASAPPQLWGEALLWAATVYNNTPQATIGGEVPAQRLYGHNLVDLKKFRVFGCDAYVYIDNDKRGKIEPKFRKGIFVGISHEQNAYRILNIEDQSVTISRDVKFEEDSFTCCIALGAHLSTNETYNQTPPESERMPVRDLVRPATSGRVTNSNLLNPETMISPSTVARSNEVEEDDTKMQPDLNKIRIQDSRDEKGSDNQLNNSVATEFNVDQWANNNVEDIIEPDIGGDNSDDDREYVEPDYEFKEDDSTTIDLCRVTPTTRSGRMVAPPPRYGMVNYDAGGDLGIKGFIASTEEISVNTEPRSYKEAIKSIHFEQWLNAMKEEITSLQKQQCWVLVPLPKGCKAIKGRWVYKIKLDNNNQPIRYKARVVAKGFQQVYGIDYTETFAPVAKLKSIKLVLAIAADEDFELKQLDFDTAFLNAYLSEEVYMEQPEGFHNGNSNMVCKLNKALYGLKQAPYEWNQELHKFMLQLGYSAIICDPCVYIKRVSANRIIILCLYVDDTMVAYNKLDESIWLTDKQAIANYYPIKDLGDCEWILNMRVTRNRETKQIMLCQEAYVNRMLQQFNLSNCNPAPNPEVVADLTVLPNGQEPIQLNEQDHACYRSLVGALLYAANTTRVDIAHVVGILSRYVAAPANHHLAAAKHCLRYLRGTADFGMIFGSQSGANPADSTNSEKHSITLTAYTDSNWGGERADRKSTTGTIVKYNGNVISWLSKKQTTVATSSTEAEYVALAATTKEVLWYKMWIKEVFNVNIIPTIYGDNQSSIHLSKHDSSHQRTKHIDIAHHFIRDHVRSHDVVIVWVPTEQQQADLLTKMLPTTRFKILRDMLVCKA